MPNHYDLDCPTAPIPCTFSTFGCHVKVRVFSFLFLILDYERKFCSIVELTIPVEGDMADMQCISFELQREIGTQNIDLGKWFTMIIEG